MAILIFSFSGPFSFHCSSAVFSCCIYTLKIFFLISRSLAEKGNVSFLFFLTSIKKTTSYPVIHIIIGYVMIPSAVQQQHSQVIIVYLNKMWTKIHHTTRVHRHAQAKPYEINANSEMDWRLHRVLTRRDATCEKMNLFHVNSFPACVKKYNKSCQPQRLIIFSFMAPRIFCCMYIWTCNISNEGTDPLLLNRLKTFYSCFMILFINT